MTQSIHDLESTFARAFALLAKDWFIIVPGLVLGIIGGLLHFGIGLAIGAFYLTGDGSAAVATVAQNIDVAIAHVADTFIAIAQMAFVVGMAGSAWQHGGKTSFADGWSAFTHRWLQIFFAGVLLLVIGSCAYFISPYTLLISLVAYIVFFLYTLAAVIIGERSAVSAIVESCGLAFRNMIPTLGVVGLIIVASIAGGWLDNVLSGLSQVTGPILHALLLQIVVAYVSLVVTGEYLKLRDDANAERISEPENGV
jgi:hypothetical protein